MSLSPEEDIFLRRWIYDESHYLSGQGPAKQLQLANHAVPADLAALIAAIIPDSADQESAADSPPVEQVTWPWHGMGLETRLAEARAILAENSSMRTHA